MRICLYCALLLLVFPAGCSCFSGESPTASPTNSLTTAPVDPVYAQQLARKFCPVFYFNGDPETMENYEPDPVELMFDVSVVRNSENPGFSQKASLSDILDWTQSSYYIDVDNLNPKKNSPAEYKAVYDSLKLNYKPTYMPGQGSRSFRIHHGSILAVLLSE